MTLLIQFLLRLSFGLAAGMAITPSKSVTSGYYRNNLYVSLGLTSFTALLCHSAAPEAFWYVVVAAASSYIGSVCWLYEKNSAGRIALLTIVVASLAGAIVAFDNSVDLGPGKSEMQKYFVQLKEGEIPTMGEALQPLYVIAKIFENTRMRRLSCVTSGLLLGVTMAAMLLGHWYLNSPTMEIAPLKRLILAMGAAVALQVVVSSLGLWGELDSVASVNTQWVLFVVLRWLFGLVGVAALAWMAWQTLKIPNTQSATGILYVAVIGTFVGETMALLLSRESLFPL